MGQRHKHADVIIAWAEGAEIERRDTPTENWSPTSNPDWYEDCEYRIKPPAKKYRVALFRGSNDGIEGYTSTADNQETSNDHEGMPHFVRWLTDWIEYEE